MPEAIAFAKIAEKAGMNALLLMPPYLTECPQDGTYEYAKTQPRGRGMSLAPPLRERAMAARRLIS